MEALLYQRGSNTCAVCEESGWNDEEAGVE